MSIPTKMKTVPQISLSLILGLMLCVVLAVEPKYAGALGGAPGDIAAYVVGLRGEVEVFVTSLDEDRRVKKPGDRKWIPAQKGYALDLGARIRTGRGRVRIEFTDRREGDPGAGPSIFNLGDNTEVSISDFEINFGWTERDGYLDLIRGQIRGFIKGWGGQSGFQVRAGVAVIGVRGTEFTVDYDPSLEVVTVRVAEGEVVLTGPGGSRLIKAGKSATMIGGAFPDKPPA